MFQLIAKIFGTKSQKDIKQIMPLVEQTRKEGEKLSGLSHDELRNQTFRGSGNDQPPELRILMISWRPCISK
jgi:preprotein translocase subunit SecA